MKVNIAKYLITVQNAKTEEGANGPLTDSAIGVENVTKMGMIFKDNEDLFDRIYTAELVNVMNSYEYSSEQIALFKQGLGAVYHFMKLCKDRLDKEEQLEKAKAEEREETEKEKAKDKESMDTDLGLDE